MHPDQDGDDDGGRDNDDGDGGDDDDGTGDEDDWKWFDSPMTYIDFKNSLKGMTTEKELQQLREITDQNNDNIEAALENGDDHSDPEADIDIASDIRHIVNPLLDHNRNENESYNENEKNKPTITVPGVGERYKETVIAELRNNPSLSIDRLQRIGDASATSRQSSTTTERSTDVLRLFDDCGIYD
jgi:hypothetical protein